MPPKNNLAPGSETSSQAPKATETPQNSTMGTRPLTGEELELLRKREKETQPAGNTSEIQSQQTDAVTAPTSPTPTEAPAEQTQNPVTQVPEVPNGPVDPVLAYEGIDMSDPASAIAARNTMSAKRLRELGVDVSED